MGRHPELVADGTTLLLTTQYLDEADALADEISVIGHGRVIAHGTPAELKQIVGGQSITVRPADPSQVDAVAAVLSTVSGRPATSPGRGVVTVPVASAEPFSDVVRRLAEAGITASELSLHLPSLDEVFFTLTGPTDSADGPGSADEPPGPDPTDRTDTKAMATR